MANIEWSEFDSGGEMQVNDQTVGLRSGDNRRFNFPGTGIKDAAGNYLIRWASGGGAAANYITVNSSLSGSPPSITSSGSDGNIDLLFTTEGSGDIIFSPDGSGNVVTTVPLFLSTNSPSMDLEAASKGYVDSMVATYPITLAQGGTSATLVANNGGIFYSTSSSGAILAGTPTANQVLLSGTSSAPSWSTATYPATTTVNQIMYSSSNNAISGLSTANNGVLVTSNTGVPSLLPGNGMTGSMLSSNASAAPSWSSSVYSDTYTANNLLYASSTNTVSGLATANNGVLVTSGAGAPSIGSTLPTAVQGNITSLGTIGSGTWNASTISGQYGGTGVNNSGKTITLGGNFATSGAFDTTFTMTNNTSVTFPTSGTLATTTATLPSIQGTANQVLVNGTSGSPVTGTAITLTTPQSIGTGNSPTFAGLTLNGAATAASITFSSTSGIIGTTTNDNAAAGSVGEVISSLIAQGSAISISNGITANVTSISLTAGDWEVSGNIGVTASVTLTNHQFSISTTSATASDNSLNAFGNTTSVNFGGAVPTRRISLSTTTTVYLVVFANFSGTGTAFGYIQGRRER